MANCDEDEHERRCRMMAEQSPVVEPAAGTIDVYSLDNREQRRLVKALQAYFCDAAVVPQPLLRSELKGIKLDSGGPGTQPEMIVLCHHNEGRVLLTDEDGMYNDFILEACRAAGGNVFVALAPVATDSAVLANEELVEALADSGGQHGLMSIHRQQRFLTWEKSPNDVQLSLLRGAFRGGLEPLEVPPSVMRHKGGRTLLSFCAIL